MDQESHLHSGDLSVVIGGTFLRLRDAVTMTISNTRQRVMRSFIVFFFTLLLLCLAVFLYGSFYYSYMPMAAFSTPMHFHYRCVCDLLRASCIRKTQTVVTVCFNPSVLLSHSLINSPLCVQDRL